MKGKFNLSILILTLSLSMVFALALYGQDTENTGSPAVASPDASTAIFLVEDFNYPPGSLLTNNGWTAHSGAGTNPITVTSPGLTYPGYAGSGVGNAVTLTTTGEDDNRTFATQTSGSVYASAMVNVTDAAVDPTGGYFFHLGPDPISTTFRGRLYVKKDASGAIAFGITKAGASLPGDIAFTPFSYAVNTTYLLVIKYTIVDGANNDTVSLLVNPVLTGTEPAATVTAPDFAASDINPGTVALRQGTTGTSPTVRVDGIRVTNSFAGVGSTAAARKQPSDWNGDGITDFGLVRADSRQFTWYTQLNNVAGTINYTVWGANTDFITPADFDGDKKTDIAVWRQASGRNSGFYYIRSSDSTFVFVPIGQAGDDVTISADYTGDGKDDPAIYRPGATANSPSQFWWFASSGPYVGLQNAFEWGVGPSVGGDLAYPGDFNGDGKADFAVYRNTSNRAVFYIETNQPSFQPPIYGYFGLYSDTFVPGDYDGDGKTDLACTRIQGNQLVWYYQPSTIGSGYVQQAWGDPNNDKEVQGDYDGDGKTDIAVWRDSPTAGSSAYYILGSRTGAPMYKNWGLTGDIPTAWDIH